MKHPRVVEARPADIARVQAAIAVGRLPRRPTAEAIRELLAISPAYARAARNAITAAGSSATEPAHSSTAKNSQSPLSAAEQPPQENTAADRPDQLDQESETTISKNPKQQHDEAPASDHTDKAQEIIHERHTYATQLT